MSQYRNDPRWITAKYGLCSNCKDPLRGKRAYFYPLTRSIYCEECSGKHEADFASARFDEDQINSQFNH